MYGNFVELLVELDVEAVVDVMVRRAFMKEGDGYLRLVCEVSTPEDIEDDEAKPLRDQVVFHTKDDESPLAVLYLSREDSRNRKSKGIRINYDETQANSIVFRNVGQERVTVEGITLEPGATTTWKERNLDDPEVQDALAAFLNRADVRAEIQQVQKTMRQ